eukprot:469735-Prymnesium_polylepis.1
MAGRGREDVGEVSRRHSCRIAPGERTRGCGSVLSPQVSTLLGGATGGPEGTSRASAGSREKMRPQ